MKMSRSILPILSLKLISMALSDQKKVESIIYNQMSSGENFAKIGPEDADIMK